MFYSLEEKWRQAIIDEAVSWIGTPFVHGQGVKGAGCDCAHLISGVFETCSLLPPIEYPVYGRDWYKHTMYPEKYIVETLRRYFTEIPEQYAQAGDIFVLFFGRAWAHCGILTGPDLAVEAWPTRSKVAEIYTKEEKLYKTHAKRFFTAFPRVS
jgi:NlpC/P60 family putative phage cell wall peptidase